MRYYFYDFSHRQESKSTIKKTTTLKTEYFNFESPQQLKHS